MPPETCQRQEIAELLPWYVNETLGSEERKRTEDHIRECPACRREVEILNQIATSVQAEHPVPLSDLYARMIPRLQPRGGARLLEWWRGVILPVPSFARVAIAAQLAVIVALAGALAYIGPQAFTTLSGSDRTIGPAVRLQVIFTAQTTAAQIRDALLPMNAIIVDGPTSLGVFTVDVPLGATGNVASKDEAVRRLQALPFVELVQVVEERQ